MAAGAILTLGLKFTPTRMVLLGLMPSPVAPVVFIPGNKRVWLVKKRQRVARAR